MASFNDQQCLRVYISDLMDIEKGRPILSNIVKKMVISDKLQNGDTMFQALYIIIRQVAAILDCNHKKLP